MPIPTSIEWSSWFNPKNIMAMAGIWNFIDSLKRLSV